ncbi:type I-C CRISPR-associated protein Cas8c/Csd1 [Paenibacillus sp. J2TS4]|uniref:type I-C CRISPR-associated protein Cas8c/Csd1 n=1 Tax=Paenibacillus sp. J2TS4 TaxID=2807194 RepID=UPI0020BE42A1|nr:type I-C CRISPR-associated protein Cas8c/Csd1 [Paenibacillus sp. J2TS4]
MQQLRAVYDENSGEVGEFAVRNKQRFTLLPIAHMTQGVQVTITVTADGEFYKAEVVPKEDGRTITPMSLDSANRAGSKVAPHYIHDKLFYVAGDYIKFGTNAKRNENFAKYLEQMEHWASSAYAHHKVITVTKYVAKGQVIQDLIAAGWIWQYPDGKLVEKWDNRASQILNTEKPPLYQLLQQTIFDIGVRFTVVKSHPADKDIWEDKELFQRFTQYTNEVLIRDKHKSLCYATGEYEVPTTQHGARIRNAGDNAKLISANDDQGYTFRGKWKEAEEAVQIGYLASQKAHHALRWLIQRQGSYVDSRYFVVFRKLGDTATDVFASSLDLLTALQGPGDRKEDDERRRGTGIVEANQVAKALQGLAHSFESRFFDQTIVMALDAATTGRLSIVYYQEVDSKLYLNNLTHWHETCRWLQITKDEHNRVIAYTGTPSTYRISQAVYGEKADARVKKELYTRLLPCIVEKQAIPKDIVYAIFERVKNPESFKNTMESWEATLNIACALINKMYEKEGLNVALDVENKSRDYLFGRLLGIAEVMESRILSEQKENRATNATRYFNAFANRPARTWLVIRKQLQPYFNRMGKKATNYQILIQKVESSIRESDMNNTALSPLFLIGYSSQVQELYKKKEVEKDDSAAEQN